MKYDIKKLQNKKKCFIFSLGNIIDSKNIKISQVVNSKYAIYESNYNYQLNFGNSDLIINDHAGTRNKNFSIEELEIFAFTKAK